VLLAAATAAADTVITAEEIISCEAVSADSGHLRLNLPWDSVRMLEIRDVYEMRLPDSSRVAELAAELPQMRVTLDSGQYIPPPDVRAERLLRRSSLEALTRDPRYAHGVDTLAQPTSKEGMVARCWELRTALLDCGLSDDTVVRLLHDVNREAMELRGIQPEASKYYCCAPCGGLLGAVLAGAVGGIISAALGGEGDLPNKALGAWMVGSAVGFVPGLMAGTAIGGTMLRRTIERHRVRVNDPVLRVNRVVATAP
jgi:hypothetical protein